MLLTFNVGVNKSIHSKRNDLLRGRLIELRKNAGLTQRQLAAKLKTGQALIARIELGERRVDLVELHLILEALGVDPAEEIRWIISGFDSTS